MCAFMYILYSVHKYTHIWYLQLSISASTPAGIKKYLTKVQVISDMYLKVFTYLQVHIYTWPHAWL